jgi:hypothetical protein
MYSGKIAVPPGGGGIGEAISTARRKKDRNNRKYLDNITKHWNEKQVSVFFFSFKMKNY